MTTTHYLLIAGIVLVLLYSLYRLKRRYDKRCPECHSLRTLRKHSMVPIGEVSKYGAGHYEVISISGCKDCLYKWLYRSLVKHYPAHEIIYRKFFHPDDFVAHDQQTLRHVLGCCGSGRGHIGEKILARNYELMRLQLRELPRPPGIKLHEKL